MGTSSSIEMENQALKAEIAKLKTQLAILQDQEFLRKLDHAFLAFGISNIEAGKKEVISWAPGAGKHLVSYIAEDFDAPLEDFAAYM